MLEQSLPTPNFQIGGITSDQIETHWAGYSSPEQATRVAEMAIRLWRGKDFGWRASFERDPSDYLSYVCFPRLLSVYNLDVSVGVDDKGRPNALGIEPTRILVPSKSEIGMLIVGLDGKICFGDLYGQEVRLRAKSSNR